RILDYSLLSSDEEFEYQKKIVRFYVEKTQSHSENFANMIPNLKKRLDALGENDEYTKGGLQAATKKYLSQKQVVEPLMQAHAEYGKCMVQSLEFLQKNNEVWTYENDEILINDETLLIEYRKLYKVLGDNEVVSNTLSEKLVKGL